MRVVIAFDLGTASGKEHALALPMLDGLGLRPMITQGGATAESVVMGELKVEVLPDALRDFVWKRFDAIGLRPRSLSGGILHAWAEASGERLRGSTTLPPVGAPPARTTKRW